jgi:hypothetical protein
VRPAVKIVLAPIARRGARRTQRDFAAPTQGESRGRTIWLDPRFPNLVKTLYHELLHLWHPSWHEDRVGAAEELGWSRMTWKRKAHLARLLGQAQIEGETE